MRIHSLPSEYPLFPSHWAIELFTNVIKDATSGNPKVKKGDYLSSGRLAVIDQGQELVGGYVDDIDLRCKTPLPAILFGDHTKIFKWIETPFALGADGIKVLEPCEVLSLRFLYYYLRTLQLPEDAGYSRHYKYLKEKYVPVPPLSEQKRIELILDQADAIRKKRRQAIDELNTLIPTIFYDMFGFIVNNSKNWPVVSFEEIAESRLGKMLDGKQQTGKHRRPYLRNVSVQWDRFDLTEMLEMDFDEGDRSEFCLRNGDLLVCEGGEVGRCAIWRDELSECYFQKALHRVRPYPEKATSEFILHFMWEMAKHGGFSHLASQATIAHLTGVKLKKLPVPLPPVELQRKFSGRLVEIRNVRKKLELAIREANSMFNSLVQRAFKGEL